MKIIKMKHFVTLATIFLCGAVYAQAPTAHIGPLISGTSSYVNGKWAWTDYAYDDRGVNSDATAGGDTQYPEGLRNAADLIQVQVATTAAGVQLTALLQTLIDASVPEVGFIIDADASSATGAVAMPGGAWPANQPLGAEWFVVVNNIGAKVQRWTGTGWENSGVLPASISTESNTVSVTLPRTLIAASNRWRMFTMTGLSSNSFTAGGNIYDLAFVVGELITDRNSMIADSALAAFVTGGTTLWQDQHQSAILAGSENSDAAAAIIDFGRMAAKDTELASATQRGWYTFLHHSDLMLAEGVEQGASALGAGSAFTTRRYLGAYQPYLVLHNGAITNEIHPLVVFLHGASQTHLQNTYWFEPAEANNTFNYPAITVFPLARGEVLYYNDISEFDVLEVLDDVLTRLPVDPERVVLTGFSMGGMGTYKLASLYPDRFSTAVAHFGASRDNDVTQLMENLVNLPFRADNGMIDYLVQVSSFLPDRERAIELGYDFRFFDVSNAHHALQPHLANCLLVNAIARKRVKNPAKLVYAIEAERIMDDPDTGLRLNYGGAYWLSKMILRSNADYGVVRGNSLGRPDRNSASTLTDEYYTSDKRDYCGIREDNAPSPAAGFHWRERSIIQTPSTLSPVSNGIELELESVDALTLDLTRMSVVTSKALQLLVNGDGPSSITLLGDWNGLYELTKEGERLSNYMPDTSGALVLAEDFTGNHSYMLRAVTGTGGSIEEPANPPQRRSGGGSFSPLTLLFLCALLLPCRWSRTLL
jgi:pimeloyl-ACP methyl ester carboxylesterase